MGILAGGSFFKNPETFEVVTVIGNRYTVTRREVLGWFFNRYFIGFYIFVLLSVTLVLPQNYAYGLPLFERAIFWVFDSLSYIITYVTIIMIGSLYAISRPWRLYYIPIGIIPSVLVATLVGIYYIQVFEHIHFVLTLEKIIQFLIDILVAVLFDVIFFGLFLPRIYKVPFDKVHPWENIDDT